MDFIVNDIRHCRHWVNGNGQGGTVRVNGGWGCGMTIFGTRGFSRRAQLTLAAAGFAFTGVVGSAIAADLPAKAPVPYAPYNWSGCYVGGYFGFGLANNWQTTDLNGFNPGAVNPWSYSMNSSATGGGYVGCNWQPTPGGGFVFGVDGEGGYLGLSAKGPQLTTGGLGVFNVVDSSKIGPGYGVVAGRVGWVFLEKIHIYGKVGVAFYDDSSTISNFTIAGAPTIGSASKSQTPLAYGVGAEYPLTEHWIGKAEYLAFDNGSSYTVSGVAVGLAGGPPRTFSWTESPSVVQTFKLGAAYKF
jgi:outer membrane immunogenic protein